MKNGKIFVIAVIITLCTTMLSAQDVGVDTILLPGDIILRGYLSPQAQITNYGASQVTLYAFFMIYDTLNTQVYLDSTRINNINSGNSRDVNFESFLFSIGRYNLRCSTGLAGDVNPTNDVKFDSVIVLYTPPWVLKESVPAGPLLKPLRTGAALTVGQGDKIYALKGNKTREFYYYDISSDTWVSLESIPNDTMRAKYPHKGTSLTYNKNSNPDIIYATKGNNTLEFWAYDVENDSWFQKPNVPVDSPLVRKVKGGASLTYLKQGPMQYVYLLKGSNTFEFYAYDCIADVWIETIMPAPVGPDSKKFRDGSCITSGGDNILYVLKGGGRFNEFYGYDAVNDTWLILESLPRYSTVTRKNSKVKDGASLTYDGDSLLYAFKGGNRQEFWMYNLNQHAWTELDSVPVGTRRKKVGSGSGMGYASNQIFLLKGNKTPEFWCYTPGISDVADYVKHLYNTMTQSGNSLAITPKTLITITPNPITERSVISLSLTYEKAVKINLYNCIGQIVSVIADGKYERGSHSFPINGHNLVSGVYMLRCDIENNTQTIKLIVK